MDSLKKQRIHKRINFKCLHCTGPYTTPHYRKHLSKYCSRRCTALATRITYETICQICNKTFEHIASRCNKAKYCSQKCYRKAVSQKGTFKYTCFHCNKIFMSYRRLGRKYCSRACVNKTNKKIWKGKYTTIRKNMIARGLLNECQKCGYDTEKKILGVHHIDRNRNNNEMNNLMVLCPNCHSLEHLKHIVM